MGRARASKSEWIKRVRAWRASGESAGDYSARHGWNERTLTWWASRLGRSGDLAVPRIDFVQFVERREATPKPGEQTGLEVVLSHGRCIRVHAGADLGLLRAVVEALEVR